MRRHMVEHERINADMVALTLFALVSLSGVAVEIVLLIIVPAAAVYSMKLFAE